MDFRYRRSYRLRVILPAMLSAMFPSTRAQFYSLLVTTAAAGSMTAVPPTRHHCHPLFMIGSTPCLNMVMLLIGIDMMVMEPHMAIEGTFIAVTVHHGSRTMRRTSIAVAAVHHGHGGHGAWRTWSMADMEHGYGGTSIAVAAVHYGSMAITRGNLHRSRSGPP